MKLSVIIPTVGRDTLDAAVASCEGADEVIVIEDQTGDHGYTARTKGIAQATGTHLAFMDDDDVYLPGAIDVIRAHESDRPVIFRMDHYTHGILWRDPAVRFGNVSTQMFVVPNRLSELGVWAPHMPGLKEPGGDFTFIAGCVEKMGEPVWREEVISSLRPHLRPSITVVTPWQNHAELADGYFEAIEAAKPDALVIVDNGSEDPLGFATVRFDENRGFNFACNYGLGVATTDAVCFLNNDIEITDSSWLDAIRGALEPGVLVGAQIRRDPHTTVDGRVIPYLDGWCVAGMRADLEMLGGWDETLMEPAYYGDNLLSLRARQAGMRLVAVQVGLRHLENQTANDLDPRWVAAVSAANRRVYEAAVRDALMVAA